jgi:hypothetical protein
VVDYYRTLLPGASRYFLGGFSIKKGANIYGIIFGSAHPLGMDKFLRVAWQADEMNGEADFDINRDDCGPLLSALLPPRKIAAFEGDLTARIQAGAVQNEADIINVCFQHGVRRQRQPGADEAETRRCHRLCIPRSRDRSATRSHATPLATSPERSDG